MGRQRFLASRWLQAKEMILIIALIFVQSIGPNDKIKEIPDDLKEMNVTNFFESDEILRVWRFPEGGTVFEEMIEFVRIKDDWKITRYTYLADEYKDGEQFQSFRKTQNILQNDLCESVGSFINKTLLYKNAVVADEEERFCVCDMYRAEYRINDQSHIFVFNLDEVSNTNTAKKRLISELDEMVKR